MKTSLAVLLLVTSTQARLMSIGEKLRQSPILAQLETEKWDSDTLGLIDIDSYTRETRYATSDQAVNIEFENKKLDKKQKSVTKPVQNPMSIVQTTITSKLAIQEALAAEQEKQDQLRMKREKQLEEEQRLKELETEKALAL